MNIRTIKVMDSVEVAADSSSNSDVIDLEYPYPERLNGFFSIQVEVTGDGTAKFEYLISCNGTNYLVPTSAAEIAIDVTKISGPGGDGKDIYKFSPELSRFLKIKVTETGTSDSVTVTIWLSVN